MGRRQRWERRVVARRALVVLLLALLGAVAGLIGGIVTPAHVELAGSDTRIWLEPGETVDRIGVTGVVTLTRATSRELAGEPIGVRATIEFDASQLVRNGQINTDVVPAYVAAYSDPDQLVSDVRHALIWHLARWVIGGGALVLLLIAARWWYRRWRTRYDRAHDPDGTRREQARRYRRPERIWTARAAAAVVAVLVLAQLPAAGAHPSPPRRVVGNPILADTPLKDVEVSGLLSPALVAARNYIRTYAGQTDQYYDTLRDKLVDRLGTDPVTLPEGEDVAHFGFVTDRHCNIGMDRVTVALLRELGVHTLVSGGDDAFSGSFPFESACTRNLAQQSVRAGITDVMVGGNHDSPQTVEDERKQGMKTLEKDVVDVDGLRFVGSPDPRTSRYGEGIRPADPAARQRALNDQADGIAKVACDAGSEAKPLIAVAHDPGVGQRVLHNGCSNVTLALDGHTHAQNGPNPVTLQDGGTGEQFTGGSGGGAPGEAAVDRTFASSLTVGPLNHDAFVYVVSVDKRTGLLAGITEFRFTPAQDIVVTPLSN